MDISISDNTHKRLAGLAEGFDTPEKVINRLIDMFESDPNKRPTLVFNPENEDDFKRALMKTKEAKVELFKSDGTCEISTWNARKISKSSSLRGNIWSGYLRGWKKANIVSAKFSIVQDNTKA